MGQKRNRDGVGEVVSLPEQAVWDRAKHIADLFNAALAQHRQGHAADAERICQVILMTDPAHAPSLHLLGMMAFETGGRDRALELLRRAVACGAPEPELHNNLGNVLADGGSPEEALACYDSALALRPEFPEAHYNRANMLAMLRRPDEARAEYERVIALRPDHFKARNNLGNLLLAQGLYQEAVAEFRRALEIAPDFPECHNNLGNALHARKRHAEAARHFERALALKPDYAEAHNNLGIARQAMGEAEAALASYRAALALRPNYANALHNLGNALASLQRYEEAAAAHRAAIGLNPNSAPMRVSLGNALQRLKLHAEAITCYEAAIALHADDAGVYSNLAAALHSLKRHADAIACCEKALALDPNHVEALNNLGNALEALDRFDDAMACYRKALALDPANIEVRCNIGNALVEFGHLDQAVETFESALAIAPRRTRLHLFVAGLKRFSPGDPILEAMERLARDSAAMPDEDRTELCFALAKAYSDCGRHDESFAQLLAGNALRRARTDYDERATLGQLEDIGRRITASAVAAWRGRGNDSPLPVFIVGMPRSGSTLVEQILGAHPQVAAAGELDLFHEILEQVLGPGGNAFPSPPASGDGGAMADLAARYLDGLARIAPGAARITDKMPSNFRFMGHIHAALPNARILHTRRDAADTCVSCFATLFAGGLPYSYDLGELGRYWRAYDALMRHWTAILPPGTILDVRYEELVADLEGQARRIVAHCGIDWDDRCLGFFAAQRPVRTASASQVRRPVYRGSVGRHRLYGPGLLRPLYDALGIDDPAV